jgi:hypothetical protein
MVGPLLMLGGACQVPWHAFQSQLSPHAGSQKSPGHQFMLGPGCASASVAAAIPTHPKPAAITAVAAIQLANLFMRYGYRDKLCGCPADLCVQMSNCRRRCCCSSRHAAARRLTSGRFRTKRRFGLPTRPCGSRSRTPGTAPRRAGTHKCAADPGRTTVHRGRVRGVPR